MIPRKLFAVLCIVFFVVAVFSAASRFVFAGPPSSGDWIVTGTESYSDQVIVLNGNLIVENGGNLTFRRVTLKLNCHYDGEFGIEVRAGESFYVLEGSIITSVAPNNEYAFVVEQNSTFRMSNSELHECGWEHPGEDGLHIFSDDTMIENCLMSHNFYNVVVHSSGVIIRNNNITANFQGITMGGMDIGPTVYNNHISWNTFGINFAGCSPSIYNNTITSNQEAGINLANATSDIRNNFITNNGDGIRSYSYSNPLIFNNTITSNLGMNIYCQDHSSGIISNNTITGSLNNNGIHCENSDPTIQYNNISQNNGCGICTVGFCSPIISNNVIASNGWAGINPNSGSNPKIESNIIMKNGVGIFCVPNASGMISGNTITENFDGGIRCHGSSNPTIQGNNITANNGVGIGCDNSNPTIQGNNITGHFPAPDFGWGAGIFCYNNSAGTIKENSITHNFNGIICLEYSDPSIDGNSIRNNEHAGIRCGNNSGSTIRSNNITANGCGISLERSNAIVRENVITSSNETGIYGSNSSPIIQGNSITSNKEYGIAFKPNCTGIIQGNVIAENERGIVLYEYCSPLIQGNRVTKNNFEGILLQTYCNPTIQGNIITYNGVVGGDGIHCEDKSNPEIHNNDIYSNTGFGIVNLDLSITINAIKNYWGSPTGPVQSPPDATDPEELSPGTGIFLYNPWLIEPILIVEITNPLSNETVSATVTVSANVRARSDVQRVEFQIDGLTYTDFDSPYEWSWDTTQYAETEHTMWIVVHDIYGLITKVSRTVFVDNTSPTVLFEEPQSGITYCGMVTIGVNATDNRELGNVRVEVDNGAWLVMTYNPANSLWEYIFNTTALSDAQHTIMSLALDKAGNPATTSITILTDNTPPALTIQHPQSGITVGLTLTVMVQANDISSVSKVEFYLHNPLPTLVSTVITVPYQWAWDTTKYPNGIYTITVKAYDTIGNIRTRDITVTVNNVEVPWLQANLLTIVQVAIGLGGLAFAIVTYWSRTKDKRKKKKTTKKKETTNVPPQKNLSKQDK